MHFAGITETAATIVVRVAVETLEVTPRAWYADQEVMPRHRREVAYDHHDLVRIAAEAQKDNTLFSASLASIQWNPSGSVSRT